MFYKLILFLKLSFGIKPPMKAYKALVKTLAVRNWHWLYEFSLKKMDPALDLSHADRASKKTFIFQGRGNGTLKPYRSLSNDTNKIFEKIFLNHTEDLKANIDFYLNSRQYLNDTNIQIPKCQKIIKGEQFTVVLYDYLDLKPLPIGQQYQILKDKTLMLYKTSNERTYSDSITYDKFLFGKIRLEEENHFSSAELAEIELLIRRAPVCFQHLDLGENNVFGNDVIIDWDNSGYFPLGMDFGKLLLNYFIYQKDSFYNTYKNEIAYFYQHLHHQISFKTFSKLTLYFAIVFYYGTAEGHDHTRKFKPLIENLKDLLNGRQKNIDISVTV